MEKKLSAGLCDTCANCQKTEFGDGVSEPFTVVPFCLARKFVVEPLPKEERILECDDYIQDLAAEEIKQEYLHQLEEDRAEWAKERMTGLNGITKNNQ